MDVLQAIIESQAPWMALSVVLIIFIIKLQNDKLLELGKAMASLVLLYQQHDLQAKEIKAETTWIQQWCISKAGSVDCVTNPKRES